MTKSNVLDLYDRSYSLSLRKEEKRTPAYEGLAEIVFHPKTLCSPVRKMFEQNEITLEIAQDIAGYPINKQLEIALKYIGESRRIPDW